MSKFVSPNIAFILEVLPYYGSLPKIVWLLLRLHPSLCSLASNPNLSSYFPRPLLFPPVTSISTLKKFLSRCPRLLSLFQLTLSVSSPSLSSLKALLKLLQHLRGTSASIAQIRVEDVWIDKWMGAWGEHWRQKLGVYRQILRERGHAEVISWGLAGRRRVEWLGEVYWEVGREGDDFVEVMAKRRERGEFEWERVNVYVNNIRYLEEDVERGKRLGAKRVEVIAEDGVEFKDVSYWWDAFYRVDDSEVWMSKMHEILRDDVALDFKVDLWFVNTEHFKLDWPIVPDNFEIKKGKMVNINYWNKWDSGEVKSKKEIRFIYFYNPKADQTIIRKLKYLKVVHEVRDEATYRILKEIEVEKGRHIVNGKKPKGSLMFDSNAESIWID